MFTQMSCSFERPKTPTFTARFKFVLTTSTFWFRKHCTRQTEFPLWFVQFSSNRNDLPAFSKLRIIQRRFVFYLKINYIYINPYPQGYIGSPRSNGRHLSHQLSVDNYPIDYLGTYIKEPRRLACPFNTKSEAFTKKYTRLSIASTF